MTGSLFTVGVYRAPQWFECNQLANRMGLWYEWIMPTVLRIDGWRVVIYPNDHRPAHVHVKSADGEAVFALNCPDGPPELREVYEISLPAARSIQTALALQLAALCAAWKAIHGNH